MENIKLNYLHLFDAASVDALGKINILGIFTKLFLTTVPSKFLKFTAVGNISFKNVSESQIKIEIKIFDPKKNEIEIKPAIVLTISIPDTNRGKEGDINIILDLGNIEFKVFGKHNLSVYVNGKVIDSKSFIVEERKGGEKV